MKTVWCIVLVSFAFLSVWAWAEEKNEKESSEQSVLDVKPHELLPADTKIESSNIKVILRPCKDEDLLKAVCPGKGYNLEVGFKVDKDGKIVDVDSLIWSRDAIHEIWEKISLAGYEFQPNKDAVLVFQVVPEKGYVFIDGVGRLVCPDKKEIELNAEKRGLIIGHPSSKDNAKDKAKPKESSR